MDEAPVFQRLQKWQDQKGIADDDLAKLVSRGLGRDIHRTTILRAKRGQRVLGMDIQLELQKHTKIPPSEWADFFAQTVHLRPKKSGSRGGGSKAGGPFVASTDKEVA